MIEPQPICGSRPAILSEYRPTLALALNSEGKMNAAARIRSQDRVRLNLSSALRKSSEERPLAADALPGLHPSVMHQEKQPDTQGWSQQRGHDHENHGLDDHGTTPHLSPRWPPAARRELINS
jgi:hypothetical protein